MVFGRRVSVRRANNPGDKRRFAGIQLAHVLAEICLGRFAESTNRKTSPIAEVNVIGVELENLLLRKTLVQLGRHQNFFQLAAPFALRGEKKRARHLHIDGAGALRLLVRG